VTSRSRGLQGLYVKVANKCGIAIKDEFVTIVAAAKAVFEVRCDPAFLSWGKNLMPMFAQEHAAQTGSISGGASEGANEDESSDGEEEAPVKGEKGTASLSLAFPDLVDEVGAVMDSDFTMDNKEVKAITALLAKGSASPVVPELPDKGKGHMVDLQTAGAGRSKTPLTLRGSLASSVKMVPAVNVKHISSPLVPSLFLC
jgi:hypothetical protein